MITITGPYIRQTEEWQKFLKELPYGTRGVALNAAADYLIGNESHGLKHEPYYKYVNRQAGFPGLAYISATGKIVPGYKSAKQHGYVMAAIASGEIRPGQNNRTHQLSNAWVKYEGTHGYISIRNVTPYAKWVMGAQQTVMHMLIGWRKKAQIVSDNMAGMIRSARAAVKKWIDAKKPK